MKNISKWKIFLAIIVIWGIAYLAMFPGIYDYDSIDQTLLIFGYREREWPPSGFTFIIIVRFYENRICCFS